MLIWTPGDVGSGKYLGLKYVCNRDMKRKLPFGVEQIAIFCVTCAVTSS